MAFGYGYGEDRGGVRDLFRISCLQMQPKYKLLGEFYPLFKTDKIINTKIFLSLPSLFRVWKSMIRSCDEFSSSFTGEFITSCILNIIAHYKGIISSSRVYLYIGNDAFDIPEEYSAEIGKALDDLLPNICKFIPNAYFVKCDDVPGCAIIGNILLNYIEEKHCDNDEYLQTLFVTSKPSDYLASSVKNTGHIAHGFYRGFGFDRRILVGNEIITNWLFHDSRKKPWDDAPFLNAIPYTMLLMLGMIGFPKKSKMNINKEDSANARKILLNLLYKNDTASQEEANLFKYYISNYENADIWNILEKYKDLLNRKQLEWRIDNVDYSIEKLNETLFRGMPVDIHKLYINR
jgi:hypothetical protein